LLLWHAARGTKIKILLAGISFMLKEKDKILLNKLTASSPNIVVQPFIYDKRSLHRLHRVIHSKLFITISHTQPAASLVITGGRNIKDSYLFYGLSPDYSAHPSWIQYGSEEAYIYYWDLEVAIRNHEVAKQVASQFFAIWNRDRKEYFYRPASLHVAVSAKNIVLHPDSVSTAVRHLLSIPYTDNRQMEKLFTDMIHAAKEHIRIVSPYFRLTSPIRQALEDALDRGVKIEFVTRLKLAGDNTPIIAEDVNKDSVNKFYKKMDIYAWEDPVSILHVKAMQIDSDMLYLGAANMNQRSFAHDIESGFVLYGKKPSAQFQILFENVFKKQSERIHEKQSIRWISKLIIPLFGGFF
jgi:phosphatidylserine/phosphatidylglycerophosphate/cardiolipin synthase-like enzyme